MSQNVQVIKSEAAPLPRDPGAIMESVIVKGDLAKLSPAERAQYYAEVCRSIGLNPLTKPFEYITLNGKLTLYALRGCTDQLRSIYGVSVDELAETEREGILVVTAKVHNAQGRTDMAKGVVTLHGLKGEALANAIMKAETKAKRRATLSICGLGMLDETELETIPAAARRPPPAEAAPADPPPHDADTGKIIDAPALITAEQVASLQGVVDEIGMPLATFLTFMRVERLTDLPADQYPKALKALGATMAARSRRAPETGAAK